MKNKILLFLLCLLLLFFPPNKSSAKGNYIDSNVIIGFKYENEFIPVGTGVYLKTKLGKGILTAKHVSKVFEELDRKPIVCTMSLIFCEELKSDYISPSSNEIYRDWAFYSQKINFLHIAKVDKKKIRIEDDVTVVGNSWGFQPWVSEGNIAWKKDNEIMVNAFCAPGCSGGGVFRNKKLIGIISAILNSKYGPQPNQIIIVPIAKIEIIE